jgi:uncharacterized protein
MTSQPRVVYDCNVLLQALISQKGPAGGAVEAVRQRRVALFLSQFIIDELRDVAARPHLATKFSLTDEKISTFIADLQRHSHLINTVPHVFDFDRDPDDANYVDLAVAANATLIVSRDADLLSLSNLTTPEGRDFAARFPGLEILTPPQLLARIAPVPGP